MASQGKRMVPENLISILKEMDSKGVSIADLADMLEAFTDDELQPTLTAGDNITISEENVISATDTTYTAGTGITINENNEISANAGEVWESKVNFNVTSGSSAQYLSVRLFTKEEVTTTNAKDIVNSELNNHKTLPCFSDNVTITISNVKYFPVHLQIREGQFLVQTLSSSFERNGTYGTITPENATYTVDYSHKIN